MLTSFQYLKKDFTLRVIILPHGVFFSIVRKLSHIINFVDLDPKAIQDNGVSR